MTIVLHWWFVPMSLFFVGIIAWFICAAWGESQGGGTFSGLFEGMVGIALMFICWMTAIGICIGHWIA